ncbi:sensor histidine kinase [Yoonia sp. R2-816]|uniref:sensor histidine kinase n=1 Tax=Yoonia sp. R2-816 TaxID=3342638 RepID=UPI00372B633B
MKTGWLNSLRVQIVLLMTLALFPLGSVAIFQTSRVAAEAERNADLALLALTEKAAKSEELIIQRALGAAGFFAMVADDFVGNPDRCKRVLSEFVENDETFSFIGILPLSGIVTCSSADRSYDFSGDPFFADAMAARAPTIVANPAAPLSGQSVFVISEPYLIDDVFAGFISISIPNTGLQETTEDLAALGLEELITFNQNGEILMARSTIAGAAAQLPSDRTLAEMKSAVSTVFQAEDSRGDLHIYTIVPVEGSPASVLGIWRRDDGFGGPISLLLKPALFPALMWFASMAVAMLSIYTLVLRHITRLRADMDVFVKKRSTDSFGRRLSMPNEMQALYDNFAQMTDDILREEAGMENALREKNVLIKEVHHRVKNNLQLISSIMNMHIRTAEEDETRSVLLRLQDRVLSLATIHRDLYQSQYGGLVNAGNLADEIIEKVVEVAMEDSNSIAVKKDIEAVMLYPDQAVPLSLLLSEAATNAMKYLGSAGGEKPWLAVSLTQADGTCTLSIANSVGRMSDAESTGLGAQLINAFAIQLGGKIEVNEAPESYTMTIPFKVEEFVPEARDF